MKHFAFGVAVSIIPRFIPVWIWDRIYAKCKST